MKLGINGLGRIGKLTLWDQVARQTFDEIIVNVGRPVGRSLEDIAHYLERDSTYGPLHRYLHGHLATPVISDIDDATGSFTIDGVPVRVLRESRNPAEIEWDRFEVPLVVDTTGRFLDPTLSPDEPGGSVRGHLAAGAKKVLVSAPFKIKDKGAPIPEDATTVVMGVNDGDFDPRRHSVVSNASCTTNCLAHMMKPLLNVLGYKKVLSASMATIHAATSSQEVLDRLPKTGAKDLRKNRSVMNNIILTTTGAANALRLVIPEMEEIGFIAESVRVPTVTGSLVILVLALQDDPMGESIRREMINSIYQEASETDPRGYLRYSPRPNVSEDIVADPKAAAVIEVDLTHTRTAEVKIDLERIPGLDASLFSSLKERIVRVPVTQAVVYGWYDNEMGYVHMLGECLEMMAGSI